MQVLNLAHPDEAFRPTLKDNGFTVARFTVPKGIDWADDASVKALYWPALDKLIKDQTGATRVHVFDHTTRCLPSSAAAAVL